MNVRCTGELFWNKATTVRMFEVFVEARGHACRHVWRGGGLPVGVWGALHVQQHLQAVLPAAGAQRLDGCALFTCCAHALDACILTRTKVNQNT